MPPSGTASAPSDALTTFLSKWSASAAAERANYQLFLAELCDALGVERPRPAVADDAANAYVFDRTVTFCHADAPGKLNGPASSTSTSASVSSSKPSGAARRLPGARPIPTGSPRAR